MVASTETLASPRTPRLGLAVALVVAAAGWGCGKGGAKKIARDRDAAAVLVIERTPTGVTFVDEAEPNNSVAEAGELSLPGGIRGSLDGPADVDVYRIQPAAPGYLDARVSGIEGVDLILELRDREGKVLARSDRGPALVVEGLPNFPVVAGEYWLAVGEFVKKPSRKKKKDEEAGRTGPSPAYELVVAVSPTIAEGGEVEPNDTLADAGELGLGSDRFGFVGWNQDQDLWKLSLEEFAEGYCIDLDVTGVPVASLEIELVDDDGRAIVVRKGDANQTVALRNLVPVAGSDHVYVRVSSRRSNPVDPYSLRAVARLLDLDEEIEPNDDPGSAMALREDSKESAGTRRGTLGSGDVDLFRLEAVGTSFLLTVSVEPGPASDVVLEVATAQGTSLGQSERSKDGGKEELAEMPIAAGTVVVIKVTGKGRGEEPYLLRWSVVPDTGAGVDPILDEYP